MKRTELFMLTAMCAALGLALGPVLHGSTKASTIPVKTVADSHAPAAPSKADVPSAGETQPLARLTGISIRPADGGKGTEIEVSTSRSTEYRVLHLGHPDRLVLDLEGATNGTDRWRYSSDRPLLTQIRVGRFSREYGGVIRVVADLQGDPAYHVDQKAAGFRIELTPKDSSVSEEHARQVLGGDQPPKAAPEIMPAALKEVAEVTTPAPPQEREKPVKHEPIMAAPAHDAVPPSATVTRPAPADPPVSDAMPRPPRERSFPQARKAAKAAKVVTSTEVAALSRVVVPVTQSGGVESSSGYTGKRISLNLKGVDLKDFFRLIHEVSGLNIIVDPDVSGSVTTVLDDVPWDQALALVLNDNDLGDKLVGNVLRIAKLSTLEREQEDEQKLMLAREDSEPLVTVFHRLNYAKAANLAALLKTWSGGGALSRRGSVLVDDRTNTLIISDIPSHISKIQSVIDKLDTKAQQISIQARIIRATSDFVRNLSSALSYAQRNSSGSLTTAGATGNPVSGQPLTPPIVTTAPATGFGVFVLSNLGANYVINAAIAAAETNDKAKTISQPSIVTQNNVEGTVVQGTQIPIQTTINNTISVQYVQASLQLKVTPQVTQDGNVFLTIDVQNSSPGPALTFAGPTINTQSATTQVLVPNGGTVVFGGVTVHTKSNSATQVPWLGNIPVLGHLFKSTTKQENDQQLLFFVTPKILT